MTVRVGVVGAGLVAQAEHLPYLSALRDRFTLTALAEPSATVREALGSRYGITRLDADYRAMLDEGGLDAVARFRRLVRTHYGILHDTGSDFIPVMLYDWRSLPPQYRRRIIELKDRYDAIWQATLDELHVQGRLAAEPKLARLMILGAINFSATWYRSKPRTAQRVDLDTLAAETVALVLQPGR